MKVIGTIRPTTTEEIEAEGQDYVQAREALLKTVPEGFTLLHVRRAE